MTMTMIIRIPINKCKLLQTGLLDYAKCGMGTNEQLSAVGKYRKCRR